MPEISLPLVSSDEVQVEVIILISFSYKALAPTLSGGAMNIYMCIRRHAVTTMSCYQALCYVLHYPSLNVRELDFSSLVFG